MLTHTAIRNVSQKHSVTQPRAPLAGAATRAGTIELMGACMSFARNVEIYGENEPADYLYKIVSGTVRTYKVPWTDAVRSEPSICPATFSVSRWETCTRFQPKQSPIARLP
jgi:hypothetical protein